MYDQYITVRSVTWGQKGRDVLHQKGIQCQLLRAPREIAPGGCAYALAMPVKDGAMAQRILDRNGIRWVGSYLRRPDGSFARIER